MSGGMNRTQAEEYAKTMTYKQAISHIWKGKGIAYRKATMIKLHELAEIADKLVMCKDCRWYDKGENEVDTWSICTRTFGIHDSVIDTDYCSFAERREDGEA
jgi:hypothetical protein